jgi:N-acetylornithine carbamoyltransferase
MNVTMAYPEGYDLDPEVIKWTKENCSQNGTAFDVVHDPDSGYEDAHIVYTRNWVTPEAYQDGVLQKQAEIEKAMNHQGWTTNAERMARTDDAIFTHPMPVDRGSEVTDEVASGPRSAIYDIAENRLHVQKAMMALTMGDL